MQIHNRAVIDRQGEAPKKGPRIKLISANQSLTACDKPVAKLFSVQCGQSNETADDGRSFTGISASPTLE